MGKIIFNVGDDSFEKALAAELHALEHPAEAAACWSCIQGFHEECFAPIPDADTGLLTCCCEHIGTSTYPTAGEKRGVGRPPKDVADIEDFISAGRKRAALVAPIFSGMLCEWAGLLFAGGGVRPMVGCTGHTIIDQKSGDENNEQGDLHHGPNKNTLDNRAGINLWRICATCHHRWHALNDKYYGKRPDTGDEAFVPLESYFEHDGVTLATPEDQELSEQWWSTRQEKRGTYPFELPDSGLLIEIAVR